MLVDAIKGLCLLVSVATGIVGFFAWMWERPGPVTWYLRIGCSILFVVSVIGLIWLSRKPDPAPDYLKRVVGHSFYDKDGFCFAFATSVVSAVCYMEVFFQNRLDRPLIGRIAMRPSGRSFSGAFEVITFEIDCAPAAFGVARVPVPVPRSAQGQTHKFEIGATAEHPNGRGKWMRYTNGYNVQKGADFAGGGLVTGLTVAGALAGMLVLRLPDSVTISFPVAVAEQLSEGSKSEVVTLWKLGDPELEETRTALIGN